MSSVGEQVGELHSRGVAPADIARHLGAAPTTVDYHLRRRVAPANEDETQSTPAPDGSAQRQVDTREAVAALLDVGLPRVAIARKLGITKATVSYHARRLGTPVDARCSRRYDWAQIQSWYDEGHSVRECMAAFGFTSSSWSDAVKRGAVRPRPNGMPIEQLFCSGTYRGRRNLKARLVSAGLKEAACERCGLRAWQAEPITLALHHLNGDRNDNRIENLQLLCPNCHSQTDTFSGRNGCRRRME